MEAIGKFSKQKGDLQLSGKGAKSILKYLLPILTLGEKISDYNTGPKANARLNKIAQDGDGKHCGKMSSRIMPASIMTALKVLRDQI